MSGMAVPGGSLDQATGLLYKTAHGVPKIFAGLDIVDGATNITKFVVAGADIANQRAHYAQDTTVAERRARVLDQLFAVADMAKAVHDALLPKNFGAFQAADSLVNALAVALAAELNSLQFATTLPPSKPWIFENGTLDLAPLERLAAANNSPKFRALLDFPGNAYASGTMSVVEASNINGNVQFGTTRAEAAKLLGSANVDLILKSGASLAISGKGVFADTARVAGFGTISAVALALDGIISPGESAGTLTFAAPVTVRSGTFHMEVGGAASGTYDQVLFTRSVALQGGTIEIVPMDGFVAAPGSSVSLFDAPAPLDLSRMRFEFGNFGEVGAVLESSGTLRFATASSIVGSSGRDILFGTRGTDRMSGRSGDDTYLVDNNRDLVDENAAAGVDLVRSSVSFTLPAHVENLAMTGRSNIGATGNSLANSLIGNSGKNTLGGGDGNDKLQGGLGTDRLAGGRGADYFVFDDKETGASKATADYILDFRGRLGDKIDVRLVDANVRASGDQAFSFIGMVGFTKAGQIRYDKTSTDTWVYLNTNADTAAEAVIHLKGVFDFSKAWFAL